MSLPRTDPTWRLEVLGTVRPIDDFPSELHFALPELHGLQLAGECAMVYMNDFGAVSVMVGDRRVGLRPHEYRWLSLAGATECARRARAAEALFPGNSYETPIIEIHPLTADEGEG
jgi:hypothetical protein